MFNTTSIIAGDSDLVKKIQENVPDSIKKKIDDIETNYPDDILKAHIEVENTHGRRHGDLNNDGKIDKEDLEILKDYLDGNKKLSEEEKEYYDVNEDGVVDEKDYQVLFSFINRHEIEDRVRELDALYLSLIGNENSGSVVLGVDNSNIETVKAELDSAKAMLAIVNGMI
ncbi:MAG: hypothetical protein A3B68_04515 [Candidatus Melainabacteria bacterium RIFCSPHIGHO2_02_FULL_34_12]|nr:MAG: hypothetical protein A3B68_04515 [Candidatus Melainabacteria bacterium RIFCSPHIGHO2_02_FULL_34_12]